jgi:hypothetical protein
MGRAVLIACLPWLAVLLASFALLLLLVRISRARPELGRLRQLHTDQVGTAQSLSFVLTLPLFIMVLLLIVQVSQLMIGQIVVEYAAYAAARAAAVWIPARVDDFETWNCVAGYTPPEDSQLVPIDLGTTHVLMHEGVKYDKIRMAAAMACVPISPSRALPGIAAPPSGTLQALQALYAALVPQSAANPRTADRLKNKLAYTLSDDVLTVDVQFYHYQSQQELPLAVPTWLNPRTGLIELGVPPDITEFRPGQEVGWQDPITVTVNYRLALLPGPGRLLATWQGRAAPVAGIGGQQGSANNVYSDSYTYRLTASSTIGNEGEKPAYAHY